MSLGDLFVVSQKWIPFPTALFSSLSVLFRNHSSPGELCPTDDTLMGDRVKKFMSIWSSNSPKEVWARIWFMSRELTESVACRPLINLA